MPGAFFVALEHYRWARGCGFSHGEILASISDAPKPHASTAQVLCALQRAWLALGQQEARAA